MKKVKKKPVVNNDPVNQELRSFLDENPVGNMANSGTNRFD